MDESITRISRAEVARRTDMDIATISRFLTGKRVPDAHQLRKMAAAMGMSMDELYKMLYSGT